MNSPNENIDPRSLPNLSSLLSLSAHKRSNKAHKGSPAGSGLKDSSFHNLAAEHRDAFVDHLDTHLPTPPNSQSMDSAHDKLAMADETRLPISPPPEEEIRIKELSAHGNTPKQPQSRVPVASRAAPSAAFKFPPAPQSFAHYQQRIRLPVSAGLAPDTVVDASTAANPNPRKRTRSTIPPSVRPSLLVPSTTSEATITNLGAVSTTTAQSPNPKPRKQPKVHASGVYSGSGFKRRHKRGTSSESLDAGSGDASATIPPPLSLKSPARKKRTHDHGTEDYTPQRERAPASTTQSSPSKAKPRVRRSATPDVPYEPPAEQFTPPRQVVLQLPPSTTSARSRKAKPSSSTQVVASVDRKVVKVKPERLTSPFPLPPVDLSKPAPPPSPTDDPLLLVGPSVPVHRSTAPSRLLNKKLVDAAVGSDTPDLQEPGAPVCASRPLDGPGEDESRWPMGPAEETALMDVAFDGPSHFDATFDPESDSDGDAAFDDTAAFNLPLSPPPAPGTFDPDQSTGSHIFHSDDEDADAEAGEDEGEYTGKFKFYSVPVKQDPPSSATRTRRDSWGRPISPFPFQRRISGPPPQAEVEAAQSQDELPDDESPPPSPSEGRKRSGASRQASRAVSPVDGARMRELRTGGFTLSEMEARLMRRNESGVKAREEDWEAVNEDEQDVTVRVEDREASDEEEEVESVEREVTPMDEEVDIEFDEGQGPALYEEDLPYDQDDLHSEDQPNVDLPVEGERSDHSDDESVDEESAAPRPVSPGSFPLTNVSEFQSTASSRKVNQFTDHYAALRTTDDDTNNVATVEAYDHDDDSSDEEVPSLGIVEISSDDPKAAARAAAILKLHHSYILDGVVAQRARRRTAHPAARRASFAFGDGDAPGSPPNEDIIRRARRKSLASTGGVMQHRPRQTSHSPLARSVFLAPGSPAVSMTSAEDALREAETQIRVASASPRGPRTPLRSRSFEIESPQRRLVTPSPVVIKDDSCTEKPQQETEAKKAWTKADWKRLDTCFTDERLALGNALGLEAQMAGVDEVEIEAVVDRFLTDAQEVEEWDREMLIRRAVALSARQRAGQGAPPSPGRLVHARPVPELVVPVFTPPSAPRTFVPLPEVGGTRKLPPSLLAPRYAHLHEEAAVSTIEQPLLSTSSSAAHEAENPPPQKTTEPTQKPAQPSTPQSSHPDSHSRRGDRAAQAAAPPSATKRVWGYLGSFLGRGSAVAPSKPTVKPTHSALPLPPPEMRQTVRAPVSTPAKKAIPKSQAPRELVHLAETLLPSKPCPPPKAKSAREMVNLHHIDPPRSVQRRRTTSGPIIIPGRTRKDSGGSVKDLVRSFEEVQRKTEEEMRSKGKTAMRKVASVGDLKTKIPWRP